MLSRHTGAPSATINPWATPFELDEVYDAIFDETNISRRRAALVVITQWRQRMSKLPLAIDATASLVALDLSYPAPASLSFNPNALSSSATPAGSSFTVTPSAAAAAGDSALALALASVAEPSATAASTAAATAVVGEAARWRLEASIVLLRVVNGIVDPMQKTFSATAVSVLASNAGLPRFLVDLRHDATHQDLPAAPVLRLGVRAALTWFKANFWEAQIRGRQDRLKETVAELKAFRKMSEAAAATEMQSLLSASSGATAAAAAAAAAAAGRGKGKKGKRAQIAAEESGDEAVNFSSSDDDDDGGASALRSPSLPVTPYTPVLANLAKTGARVLTAPLPSPLHTGPKITPSTSSTGTASKGVASKGAAQWSDHALVLASAALASAPVVATKLYLLYANAARVQAKATLLASKGGVSGNVSGWEWLEGAHPPFTQTKVPVTAAVTAPSAKRARLSPSDASSAPLDVPHGSPELCIPTSLPPQLLSAAARGKRSKSSSSSSSSSSINDCTCVARIAPLPTPNSISAGLPPPPGAAPAPPARLLPPALTHSAASVASAASSSAVADAAAAASASRNRVPQAGGHVEPLVVGVLAPVLLALHPRLSPLEGIKANADSASGGGVIRGMDLLVSCPPTAPGALIARCLQLEKKYLLADKARTRSAAEAPTSAAAGSASSGLISSAVSALSTHPSAVAHRRSLAFASAASEFLPLLVALGGTYPSLQASLAARALAASIGAGVGEECCAEGCSSAPAATAVVQSDIASYCGLSPTKTVCAGECGNPSAARVRWYALEWLRLLCAAPLSHRGIALLRSRNSTFSRGQSPLHPVFAAEGRAISAGGKRSGKTAGKARSSGGDVRMWNGLPPLAGQGTVSACALAVLPSSHVASPTESGSTEHACASRDLALVPLTSPVAPVLDLIALALSLARTEATVAAAASALAPATTVTAAANAAARAQRARVVMCSISALLARVPALAAAMPPARIDVAAADAATAGGGGWERVRVWARSPVGVLPGEVIDV